MAFIVNDTDFFLSHRISLAKMCQKEFETVVIVPKSPKNQKIKEEGFRVIEYPLQKTGTNPLGELFSIFKIFRILRKEKPHFVHNFTIKPALYGSLASRWAGVPNIIVTITGLGFVYVSDTKKSKVIRPFVDILYKWAMQTPKVRVIFQNPDDKKLFTKNEFIPSYRTTIIPGSGVNPNTFFPKERTQNKDRFVILVPCRMLWDKGVADIVEAFKRLNLPENYELHLAGKTVPGNPAAIPEKTLKRWESESNVKWLGFVKDMNNLFNNCDIVCLPSYREGLPLALLEASLCEKAILTTDVPGCNFLIQDGINGLVVPAKSPDALADGLRKLIEDDKLRTDLAQKARAVTMERYTCDSINSQILGFYHEKTTTQREHKNA